jgi:hypothetical protein
MVREPLLTTVDIADLRPTQITVGLREVAVKRKRWREIGGKKGAKFLGKHMIPVILGPKKRHYVIDHHHLALALPDSIPMRSGPSWTIAPGCIHSMPRVSAGTTRTFPNAW